MLKDICFSDRCNRYKKRTIQKMNKNVFVACLKRVKSPKGRNVTKPYAVQYLINEYSRVFDIFQLHSPSTIFRT